MWTLLRRVPRIEGTETNNPEQSPVTAIPRDQESPIAQDELPDCGVLVGRVLEGETEAFRPLVEAFERAVFGLCRKLVFDDATEAEDLTQETFVQAFRYLPTLEQPDRFGPWLYQIARSLCRSRRRRLRVEKRALVVRAEFQRRAEVVAYSTDPTFGPESSSETVEEALAALPKEEGQLLRLRYFEGLSYNEIGHRLGYTFAQVDHRIRRARARLARRFGVAHARQKTLG